MTPLNEIAPAFVEMAQRIITCSGATVDARGRARTRMLQPIWLWDGENLTGWVAAILTPVKRAHLEASPFMSCNYWIPNQDTCVAECRAEWAADDEAKQMVWDLFANTPGPIGYDPSVIAGWENVGSPTFAGLKLEPWRIRVMPGTIMTQGKGEVLTWRR